MTAIIDQQWQDAVQAASAFDRVSGFTEKRAEQMTKRGVHYWKTGHYADMARRFYYPKWAR